MSCEDNAPSFSSDSSQNIPQVATSGWVHTSSRLILRERGRAGGREGGRESWNIR